MAIDKKTSYKSFLPLKLEWVEQFLLVTLKAIKIPKEKESIQMILDDPYCPDRSLIHGVYVIYQKSVLELLEGKISSIHSYEFTETKKKDRTISANDIEYVLETATVVVLASENDGIFRRYFYGGANEKLDSIFNFRLGYSKELENKKYKLSLQRFMKDIKIVEQMGLLERLMKNK